jgi:hypothetical protein
MTYNIVLSYWHSIARIESINGRKVYHISDEHCTYRHEINLILTGLRSMNQEEIWVLPNIWRILLVKYILVS